MVPLGASLVRGRESCKDLSDFPHGVISVDAIPVFYLDCDIKNLLENKRRDGKWRSSSRLLKGYTSIVNYYYKFEQFGSLARNALQQNQGTHPATECLEYQTTTRLKECLKAFRDIFIYTGSGQQSNRMQREVLNQNVIQTNCANHVGKVKICTEIYWKKKKHARTHSHIHTHLKSQKTFC